MSWHAGNKPRKLSKQSKPPSNWSSSTISASLFPTNGISCTVCVSTWSWESLWPGCQANRTYPKSPEQENPLQREFDLGICQVNYWPPLFNRRLERKRLHWRI